MYAKFHREFVWEMPLNLNTKNLIRLIEQFGFEFGEKYYYHVSLMHDIERLDDDETIPCAYYWVPFWRKPILWQGNPIGFAAF